MHFRRGFVELLKTVHVEKMGKNKLFLIPGNAKAGTTFLFDQLVINADVFNKPITKEINYFVRKTIYNEGEFLKQFKNHVTSKIFLDASPVYLQSGQPIAERVQNTFPDWEVFVLILIRDPISTLFSHYLHDIKSHHGRLSSPRTRPKSFDLHQPEVLNKYVRPKYPQIKDLFDTFGSSCIALPMGSLFNGIAHNKIQRLLSEKLTPFDIEEKSNQGGFIPEFHYGGTNGTTFKQGGVEYLVPPCTMVSAANARSEIMFNVGEADANKILSMAKTFSNRISIDRKKLEPLIEDHEMICREFDVSCPIPAKYDQEIRFDASFGQVSDVILKKLMM